MRMESDQSPPLVCFLATIPEPSPRSVRCNVGTGSSMPELMAALSAMDFRELRGSGAWGEKDRPGLRAWCIGWAR